MKMMHGTNMDKPVKNVQMINTSESHKADNMAVKRAKNFFQV
jgi:hypothetical protein